MPLDRNLVLEHNKILPAKLARRSICIIVADIEKRGYQLAGMSYDSPQVLATFIERRGIKYTLLSDPNSEVIDRYGLRDPQYPPGNRAYGVPRPIIFILDRKGTIQAKLYEATYTKRPPIGLVIETLDKIRATNR